MAGRADIVAAARDWIGVPWRRHGRTREGGIDCVGLIELVGRELGLIDAVVQDFGAIPDGVAIIAQVQKIGYRRINPINAGDGDIIAFRALKNPIHAAILSTKHDARHMINATKSTGRVTEEAMMRFGHTAQVGIVAAFAYPHIQE